MELPKGAFKRAPVNAPPPMSPSELLNLFPSPYDLPTHSPIPVPRKKRWTFPAGYKSS